MYICRILARWNPAGIEAIYKTGRGPETLWSGEVGIPYPWNTAEARNVDPQGIKEAYGQSLAAFSGPNPICLGEWLMWEMPARASFLSAGILSEPPDRAFVTIHPSS